jgi:uncharacterized membrane protein YjjP (DUF1212 family)
MLDEILSKTRVGFKYIYLVVFFALLAGFFHPLITGESGEDTIGGVIVLFVGLVGGILLYKSATSEKNQIVFLIGGFSLIAISLTLIFQITGRV